MHILATGRQETTSKTLKWKMPEKAAMPHFYFSNAGRFFKTILTDAIHNRKILDLELVQNVIYLGSVSSASVYSLLNRNKIVFP